MRPVLLASDPPELLLYDQSEACPYLEGETARMPMRLPMRSLTRQETDQRLAAGDRRHGRLLYRTDCPHCRACVPIRVDVREFRPSRSQRRVKTRGDRVLDVDVGPPTYCEERRFLYEKHKRRRGLFGESTKPLSEGGYRAFLVDRCVDAFEVRYRIGENLIAVAISDRGATCLSLVYCFFDPDYAYLGLGTYSILKHIDFAAQWGLNHVYLGLYIASNEHMNYKARFRPNERLVDGNWVAFPS